MAVSVETSRLKANVVKYVTWFPSDFPQVVRPLPCQISCVHGSADNGRGRRKDVNLSACLEPGGRKLSASHVPCKSVQSHTQNQREKKSRQWERQSRKRDKEKGRAPRPEGEHTPVELHFFSLHMWVALAFPDASFCFVMFSEKRECRNSLTPVKERNSEIVKNSRLFCFVQKNGTRNALLLT